MAAAIPVALGAIKIFGGLKNKNEANTAAVLAEKTKPVKRTSQYDVDALALSESELANGMSAEADQSYNDSVDRQVATSISALLKGGGSVNNIGDIYGNTEVGRQNLAIVEDQMRLSQINNVLKSYDKMASEEEKNWIVNQYAPYKDKLQAIGEQKKAAQEQINKGMDTLGNGIMGAGGSNGGNIGGFFGGAGSGGSGGTGNSLGGGMGAASDRRLKHNYHVVDKSPSGINIYEFSYLGSDDRYRGVMADEVSHASYMGENGFLMVDYSKIDVAFKKL